MTTSMSTKAREGVTAAADEPGQGATKADGLRAIERWLLLSAASDADQTRTEWEAHGVALLRCGGQFCAIRVPLDVVEAAAGCTVPDEVDAYLSGVLPGAPVMRSQLGKWLYVLCEPGTVTDWKTPGTEYLGDGHQLGVPRPDAVRYPGQTASYWAVPISRPGVLATGKTVSSLMSYGRRRLAQTALDPQHTPTPTARVDLTEARHLWDKILYLTRGLPENVPPRDQLEPVMVRMRECLEALACWGEQALEEENPADRPTTRWLLGRVRQLLLSGTPTSTQEAAIQAEELALFCRALGGIHERQHRRGEGLGSD